MFEFIYELLFGLGSEGVDMAIGPLAGIALGVGSQLAGRGISSLLNRPQRRRARRRDQEARGRFMDDREGFSESVEGLEDEAAIARQLAGEDDPFGAERERRTQDVTDRVGSQLASGQTAVSRALMTTGGDVSGSGATTLQRLQEGASTTLSKALTGIDRDIAARSEQRQRFHFGRADRLQSRASGSRGRLFGQSANEAARTGRNRILQQQAERQMGADLGSSFADFGADLLNTPDDE